MIQSISSCATRPLKSRRASKAAALWCVCVIAGIGAGQGAAAAPNGQVVIRVKGPHSERLSAQITSALPPGVDAVDAAQSVERLSEKGLDELSAGVAGGKRRPALVKKLRHAAWASGAGAFIAGSVTPGDHTRHGELHLFVVWAKQNEAALDETLQLDQEGGAPARQLKDLLATALEGVRTDPAPTDEQVATEETPTGGDRPDVEPQAETPHAQGNLDHAVTATDALVIGFLGFDMGGRQFHYNQRITNANLRPYDLPDGVLLPVSPGAALSLELYPFARSAWPVARDVGVIAQLEYNFAKAQTGSVTLGTTWYSWDMSLRGRLQLGERGASPILGLEAGLGQAVFSFNGNPETTDILPGVDYKFLRIGADGRVPVGRAAVVVGAGYRHLLTTTSPTGQTIPAAGSVGEHFPRADIAGLDARIGGSFVLAEHLEARLVIAYTRYWAAFNPKPGDTYVAGGAVDQTVHAILGIAAFF